MSYTTLIQLPPTEKILDAATGDKDFWIVDTVGKLLLCATGQGRHPLQP